MKLQKVPLLILVGLLFLLSRKGNAQISKFGLGLTPQRSSTTINGLALGLWDNSLAQRDSILSINGLHLNFFGYGAITPLLPGSPFKRYGPFIDVESLKVRMDSLSKDHYFGQLYLNGISLSGFGTGYDRMNGIQIGLSGFSWAQKGLMISPFISVVGNGKGLVISLINDLGKYQGVSIGISNHAIQLIGIQLGLYNVVEGIGDIQLGMINRVNQIKYLQSGIYNSACNLNGFQLGVVNQSAKAAYFQAGILNTAGFTSGVQLGVINVAGQNAGIQIGLVNYTKKKRTFQLGLINIKGKTVRPLFQW